MRRIAILLCAAASIIFSFHSVYAAVPTKLNVQGRLTDLSGVPLPAGSKTLSFSIWDAEAGGSKLWPDASTENQAVTSSSDGLWTAFVGALQPLTPDIFSDSTVWLEITVDDGVNPQVTLPRVRLVTGPYAFHVETVDGASGGTISGKLAIGPNHDNSGFYGFAAGYGHTVSGTYAGVSGGTGNTASGGYSTIGGGIDNTVSGTWSTVGGGSANQSSGTASVVSGGADNFATETYAVVGGGKFNRAREAEATVGGGRSNFADSAQSTVAGGRDNIARQVGASIGGGRSNRARGTYAVVGGGGGATLADSNFANGDYATVSGGISNGAAVLGATVGGGMHNLARGEGSVIGGGMNNKTYGSYAAIAGGGSDSDVDSNVASGDQSFIGAGRRHLATGRQAVVGGGFQNRATELNSAVLGGTINSALDTSATVCGGAANYASASLATVGGGGSNGASGRYATIPGGFFNLASGEYSFAAGARANAAHAGAFVWSDVSSGISFQSTGTNQFLIRAAGGVGIGTAAPEGPVHIMDGSAGSVTANDKAPLIVERNGESWIHILSPEADQRGILFGSPANSLMGSIRFNPPGAPRGFHFRCGYNDIRLVLDSLGNLTADGCIVGSNIACPSDERLKRNIHGLENSLDKIGQLQGVEYEWRREEFPERELPDGGQIGLIAQNVRDVVPQAVVEQADGYLAVDYARLVPLLIEAIKSQQDQIDHLAMQMNQQQQRP